MFPCSGGETSHTACPGRENPPHVPSMRSPCSGLSFDVTGGVSMEMKGLPSAVTRTVTDVDVTREVSLSDTVNVTLLVVFGVV